MDYLCACQDEVEYSVCPEGYTCCCCVCKKRNKCEVKCTDCEEVGEPWNCEFSVRI